jgi:hypothetical protein
MYAQEKASLALNIPALVANSLRTGEEKLQSGISECDSHPGFCNAVPSGIREIRRHIRQTSPCLRAFPAM